MLITLTSPQVSDAARLVCTSKRLSNRAVKQLKPRFTSLPRERAQEGKLFTVTITAAGKPAPTLWAPAALPPGLTFITSQRDPSRGTLKGTSGKVGAVTFAIDAGNAGGITL